MIMHSRHLTAPSLLHLSTDRSRQYKFQKNSDKMWTLSLRQTCWSPWVQPALGNAPSWGGHPEVLCWPPRCSLLHTASTLPGLGVRYKLSHTLCWSTPASQPRFHSGSVSSSYKTSFWCNVSVQTLYWFLGSPATTANSLTFPSDGQDFLCCLWMVPLSCLPATCTEGSSPSSLPEQLPDLCLS